MKLLVSVRSGDEVVAALAGGADIIDAKEPARGPLGPVEMDVLSAVAACTPGSVRLSVALGDCATAVQVRAAVQAVRRPERSAPVYLKVGFAGVPSVERVGELLRPAVAAAEASGGSVVAVAYADCTAASSVGAVDVLRAAVAAGATVLLVDTWVKDGRKLLDVLSFATLADLSAEAHAAGLVFAVAGSLDCAAVIRLAPVADVVGVRGAACLGGRGGKVDVGMVRRLRAALSVRPGGEGQESARSRAASIGSGSGSLAEREG